MAKPLRYYFVSPMLNRPVGGQNVLIWLAETLRQKGYATAPLYPEAYFRYSFEPFNGESFFSHTLRDAIRPKGRKWLKHRMHLLMSPRNNHPNIRWQASEQDVFVIPEFMYPQCVNAFKPAHCILVAQDVFGLARAFTRDQMSNAPQYSYFSSVLTTSKASSEAVNTLLGRDSHRLQLPVCRKGLEYCSAKKLQIAYMPRKRPGERAMIIAGLKAQSSLADIPIISIENMTNKERNCVISESLVFLSFSEKEGFGLPPAEAMATGSIVIGYTGVGGDEYFTCETGIPVPDSDIVSFIRSVEHIIARYRKDPAPLDALRQSASRLIWERYSETKAQQSAIATWNKLDTEIREKARCEILT